MGLSAWAENQSVQQITWTSIGVGGLATNSTSFDLDVSTVSNEITQSNGHYAVQGYSRSPILVPVERSYATSY